MNIFVSHSEKERELGILWKDLLIAWEPAVSVFISTDPEPQKGIGPGLWRRELEKPLDQADKLIFLLTPISIERPWVTYEYGYARGLKKQMSIYPIVYWLDASYMLDPMIDQQTFKGDSEEDVVKVLRHIFSSSGPTTTLKTETELLQDYSIGLSQFQSARIDPRLFTDRFHKVTLSKNLEGICI